jgi:hypothetical protein
MSEGIFMTMSVSFLLQATRILHVGNYDDNDVRMIYDYLKIVDNEMIYEYYSTCTILSYENDLELFVEILDAMLKIMEESEEYEKCQVLQNKKQKCLDMSLNKII